MAILKRGLAGEPVKILQQALGVPTDGRFGPGTESALKAYQQIRGNDAGRRVEIASARGTRARHSRGAGAGNRRRKCSQAEHLGNDQEFLLICR